MTERNKQVQSTNIAASQHNQEAILNTPTQPITSTVPLLNQDTVPERQTQLTAHAASQEVQVETQPTKNTNMRENATDRFARLVSILSLIISTVAIIVPYMQYRQEQQEGVSFVVDRDYRESGKMKLTKYSFGTEGKVVQVPWKFVISNTASRKLSIVNYSIHSGNFSGSSYYSGLDGGMYDEEGNQVKLPITLESGDSKILDIYIRIMVPQKVFDILYKINNDSLSSHRAFLILSRKNLDIYGNTVEFTEYPGGASIWQIDRAQQKSPRYWFQITTGRGNLFTTSTSEYAPQIEHRSVTNSYGL